MLGENGIAIFLTQKQFSIVLNSCNLHVICIAIPHCKGQGILIMCIALLVLATVG